MAHTHKTFNKKEQQQEKKNLFNFMLIPLLFSTQFFNILLHTRTLVL